MLCGARLLTSGGQSVTGCPPCPTCEQLHDEANYD